MKHMKGNHRRTNVKTFTFRGVIGNTYNTPTKSRGAINIRFFDFVKRHIDAFLF